MYGQINNAAYLSAPPDEFTGTHLLTKSLEPARREPTGAPRPLERQGSPLDEVAGTGQEGAYRSAQALGEAEGDGVAVAGERGGRHSEAHRRVQEPRAVQVNWQLQLFAGGAKLLEGILYMEIHKVRDRK